MHPKSYFCYQCDRAVSISISASADPLCAICNEGFIEEYENPNPNPGPRPNTLFADSLGLAGFPFVFSPSSGGFGIQPSGPSSLFATAARRPSPSPLEDSFDPVRFLHNLLHNLISRGANIEFLIQGGAAAGGDPSSPLPANLGDYFLGPGFEQLIQQLAENDPNRHGTPPASRTAVQSLPDIKVSDQLLKTDSAQCAVCMDAFEVGAVAKQMPCMHIYHPDCILPWLELHNSCPVCRYELPTDDPDYETRMRGAPPPPVNSLASANADSGSGSGRAVQGDSGAMQTSAQRFRISLPLPFRVLGSLAETSSSNSDTNSNNNIGERDLDSRNRNGNQESGPEPMQEDLD